MKRPIASLSLGLVLLCFVSLGAAQSLTTGAINGTVTDQSGAVMSSVVVIAKNVDTGATRETQTTGSGNFLLAQLDPGRYEVTAESAGFEKTKIDMVAVAVSRIASVEFHLKVGSATAIVEVKQKAPLIETSNPNTTTTFNATQLANIPNPGNDLSYVVNLAPGAILNTNSAHGTAQGNVEFNGLGSVANDFTIDGLDANQGYNNYNATGASGLQLGLNAIQEVSINSTAYSVDQGRLYGSQINYVTKSGSNEFHGNAFEIWNGSAMNANNYFLNANSKPKPHSNVNEFGASFGGPIVKKRLFIFTDLEGIRLVLPVVLNSTLPTPAYQAYVLQQLPLGGTDSVLGTQLPPQPAEVPLYKNMFALMGDTGQGNPLAKLGCPFNADGTAAAGSPPNGNGCANSRVFSASPTASETLFTTKLDYAIGANDTIWFRFQLNQGENIVVDPVNNVFNTVTEVNSRAGTAGWTHVFSPNLVNQFNPGLSYLPGTTDLADHAKAQATFPITYAPTSFSRIGNSSTPFGQTITTWQLIDNLSWNKGRSSFKFGENTRRLLIGTTNASNVIPFESASSLPEFTYGATSSTTQAFVPSVTDQLRAVNLDLYAMDTFRATSRLTVSVGTRASWNSNPASSHNIFSYLNGPFQAIPHDVNRPLNLDILANQHFLFRSTPLVKWAPRAAIAYAVKRSTVVRVGFGVFAAPPYDSLSRSLSQNPPARTQFSAGIFSTLGGIAIAPGVPTSAVDRAVAANQQYQSGFASGELSCASPLATQGQCLPPASLTVSEGRTPYPYSMQWSAAAQQQLGQDFAFTIRYIGTRSVNGIFSSRDANSFQTACAGCFAPLPFGAAVPDGRFGAVVTLKTGANSSYNGVTLSAEKRMGRGLSFQVNYTYSHCLDVTSNGGFLVFNQNAGTISVLPNALRTLYGNCDYDIRHSFNGSYVYQLPFHSGKGWAQTLIGDWQVSGTLFVRGGTPFSVFSSFASQIRNGGPFVYANRVPGQDLYSKTPVQGITQPGTVQWLNPNAFQSVTSGGKCFPTSTAQDCQNGNLGRNVVRAPGFSWLDFDIAKNFRLSERLAFKFETQIYNLFNHPNFGYPGSGAPIAGIASQAGTLTNFGTINTTVSPTTSLLGGRLGADSSARMIALRGTISF